MKFKHLLWWVAGADADRLEKCPTDQKRMGAIGMVILTTAFVAFVAGTAAAMFFTQKDGDTTGKLGWSIAFGVLWAIIIFMIDRSLVVTMKKDPTKKNQFRTLAGPFIFRMILAAIIALMISIPLELFIFEGFISVQSKRYAAKEVNEYANLTIETRRINAIDSINTQTQHKINENKGTVASLDKEIAENEQKILKLQEQKNKPTGSRYTNAVNAINDKSQKRRLAYQNLENATNATDSARINKEIERLNAEIREETKIRNEELRKWNEALNSQIRQLEKQNEQPIANRAALNKDIKSAQQRMAEQDSLRTIFQGVQDNDNADFRKKQQYASRFLRDYQILSNTIVEKNSDGSYAYPTELFFYWLIRMIFFLIELLPTLVKVITPVGAYDRLVYEEEKALQDYFGSEEYHNSILAQQKADQQRAAKRQQQRQAVEDNAHLEILKQANQAQNEVAYETIRRWKEQELNKLNPNTIQTNNTHENND